LSKNDTKPENRIAGNYFFNTLLKRMKTESKVYELLLDYVMVCFRDQEWALANKVTETQSKNIQELESILK